MTLFDDLSPQAKHLLRAAKGGDDATPADVEASVSRYRQSRAARTSNKSEAFTYGRPRRVTPWAFVAAAFTATVGAYATVGSSLGLPLPEWWPEFTAWSADTTSAERSEGPPNANTPKPSPARNHALELASPAPADTNPVDEVTVVDSNQTPTHQVSPALLDAHSSSALSNTPGATAATLTVERRTQARSLALGPNAQSESTASATAAPSQASTSNVHSPSALAREVQMLTAARDALNSNECPTALRHLSTHRLEFPKGVLSEERQALTAICECRTGAGFSSAQKFVAQRAESPLTRRVTKECKLSSRP